MTGRQTVLAAALLVAAAGSLPRAGAQSAPSAPLRIVLVGDSTVAAEQGWGVANATSSAGEYRDGDGEVSEKRPRTKALWSARAARTGR